MTDVYYTVQTPQFASETSGQTSASQLICYKGVRLYARPYDKSHYQITGLCTTDPACYLRKDLMPGALIPLFQENR
ncbi:MAG: YlzJ-like family protein [Peptococcaceae bacterium]